MTGREGGSRILHPWADFCEKPCLGSARLPAESEAAPSGVEMTVD
jgi:hypothetical protein